MTTTSRGRSSLALLLALAVCASARAADFQGRGPVAPAGSTILSETPARAASASGARVPSFSAPLSVPSAAALPGAEAHGGLSLPSAAAPAVPGAPASPIAVPSPAPSAPAAPATLPAAAIGRAPVLSAASVPGDKATRVPGDKDGARAGSVSNDLSKTAKDLAPELDEVARGQGDAKKTGEEIQRILAGEEGRRRDASVPVPSSVMMPAALAHRLPNPGELYDLARTLALERSRAWGVADDRLAFGEVTASMPADADRELHFSFYAIVDGVRKVKPILVTFKADRAMTPATPYSATVRSWDAAMTLERTLFPQISQTYYFRRGSEAAPDTALQEARRALPSLGGAVSFTLRFEEQPQTGAVDLWYRFYDNAGSEVAVNSRTGEHVVARDAAASKTIDHVVGRKTVDILSSVGVGASIFPAGAAVAQHWGVNGVLGYLAAWMGVLVLGALVKVIPVPAFERWGRVIGFGAIISPLLAVAFMGLKALVGAGVAAGAAGAASVAGAVTDAASAPQPTLIASYAQASQAARSAAERAKLPAPKFAQARLTRNGWVFDFEAGDRLVIAQGDGRGGVSAYAYGAREKANLFVKDVALELAPSSFALGAKLSPEEGRRLAAARLGDKVSDVALSLIVIEQESSGDKDLWYVGDDVDGRRASVNARTGQIKDLFTGPARSEIEAAARGAASYKGMPWSQTEYNMSLAGYESGLLEKGATFAQLQLFDSLTAAAPIRGGRFNPWSGD